jgi:hypothetical protein
MQSKFLDGLNYPLELKEYSCINPASEVPLFDGGEFSRDAEAFLSHIDGMFDNVIIGTMPFTRLKLPIKLPLFVKDISI